MGKSIGDGGCIQAVEMVKEFKMRVAVGWMMNYAHAAQ